MISIIIPVYNAELYLAKCVDSILSQTFRDWELLLIDDGSSDSSGYIIDRYADRDERIRAFHKANGGVSSARNLGVKEATGDWLTFIDADDFIGDSYLDGLFDPIKKGEDVDFVHGGAINYVKDKPSGINQSYCYYVGNDYAHLFASFRGLVFSKLFKTKICRDYCLLFDEDMDLAEDMAFTIDYLLYVDSYALVPEVAYYYRCDNANSITHTTKWLSYQKTYKGFLHLYDSTIKYISKYNLNTAQATIRYRQRANHIG